MPVLVRGEVIDLPDVGAWTVTVAWRADGGEVAFLVDGDGAGRARPLYGVDVER